jgi:hypothetical protein
MVQLGSVSFYSELYAEIKVKFRFYFAFGMNELQGTIPTFAKPANVGHRVTWVLRNQSNALTTARIHP